MGFHTNYDLEPQRALSKSWGPVFMRLVTIQWDEQEFIKRTVRGWLRLTYAFIMETEAKLTFFRYNGTDQKNRQDEMLLVGHGYKRP